MPLTQSGFVSRRELTHPDEKPAEVLPYELVLKYNPNHGADGRFASAGGKRKGGTYGAPTEDAFGRPIKGLPLAAARLTGNPNFKGAPKKPAQYSGPERRQGDRRTLEGGPGKAGGPRQNLSDPIGTQYYSDKTLTPTGKKGVPPSHKPGDEPGGTIFSSGQTLIPGEGGTYIDKDTGQIYQSDAVDFKAQAARDAAKGAAYVAAYGKKKRKK